MENHLIIGLGGTGGRVLAAYRKLIFEKYKGELKPKDLWIDYVYVESSGRDLQMDDPAQWSVMGQSVKLDNDSVVEIKAANLADYVNNKNRFKYLAPWLGDNAKWSNIINDPKISSGAAGQKRRLGRLLFANGAENFNKVVGTKVANLQLNPSNSRVTFHVVAGLAGGTGSGSIVDAVAQLRSKYPDIENFKIMLYLLLPDEIPNPAWASTANYQPNGYAALTELNAMDYQLFNPWNVGEREYEVQRLKLVLPFYSAYLVTEQNNQNVKFDVQKVMPASIAEFIYQKTAGISANLRSDDAAQLSESPEEFFHRAESGENPKYEDYGCPHSFKFMTYGIKRLAIPEQEIKEYFGYSFTLQAINQMIYNNLSRENGYLGESIVNDDYSYATSKESKTRWCITREHLCLSKPILEEHKKENWRTINDEFNVVDNYRVKMMADDNIKHNDKLLAIHNLTKRFFNKEFRPIREEGQNGVQNFYENKIKFGKDAIATRIVETINADLLNLWKTGEKSLMQLSALMNAIIVNLTEEKDSVDGMRAGMATNVKKADTEMLRLQDEWGKLGLFSKLGVTNNKDQILNDFVLAVKSKYICMTFDYAYQFAKELLETILNLLITTKANIDKTNEQFLKAAELIEAEALSRCKDEDEDSQSRKGLVIKNYDANKVNSICQGAIQQTAQNDMRVTDTRNKIMELLSVDKKNFKETAEKLKVGNIVAVAEKCGLSLAETFFASPDGKDGIIGYEKLIGVNIIQKLKDEFNGNKPGLKNKLARLVRHAAVMAKHHPSEVNDGPKITESTFVVIPEYKEDEDFQKEVVEMIKSLTPQGRCKVSTGGQNNEIVVVNLEANITPRYLKSVEVLRTSYDRLMSSAQGDVARFETQLEDYEKPLPSLYKPTDEELEQARKERMQKALPYLLLAKGMGILQPMEDPETGIEKLALIPLDEDGLPDIENAVQLGRDLEKSAEKLDEKAAETLQEKVNEALLRDFRHIAKQEVLRQAMAEDVRGIMAAHKNNINDPVVKAFNGAFKVAKEELTKFND